MPVVNQEIEVDALIVGSGAGGAALALELCERGWRVAILEKGKAWAPAEHRDLANQCVSRLYTEMGIQASTGRPALVIPTGTAVGGTTLINSGTCYRTPSRILERWQVELGLKSLSETSLRASFEKIEALLGVAPTESRLMSRANTLAREGAARLGWDSQPLLRNAPGCEGCGFCCYGCPSGAKQSTDRALIPKAVELGAQLFPLTEVQELLFDGTQVIGATAQFLNDKGKPVGSGMTIRARETILAMGTLATPLFLQRQGIGNSHVGSHLTLHPATKLFGLFAEEVKAWEGVPQAAEISGLHEQGILFEGVVLPPDLVAVSLPFVGDKLIQFMANYHRMASFGFLIEDSSEGSVRWLPGLGPLIRYHMTAADMVRVKTATLFLAQVFFAAGAERVITLIHGHPEFESLESLARLEKATLRPRDFDGMAFHPLGTCRMAATPTLGAIDELNRVYGVGGLRVCDGSMVPTGLGVNPQITIMALALRLGKEMAEELPTLGRPQKKAHATVSFQIQR